MSQLRSVVKGIGSYLPARILTNKELERMVETNDEWIVERTGIKKRHLAAEDEPTSALAICAAKAALKDAGMKGDEIDLVIVATTTPDNTFPSVAVRVQAAIESTGAAFDVQAVCTGFVYALTTADTYIKAGMAKNVLVIGADSLSRILDWKDRGTCILFGDGAGAMIVSAEEVRDDEEKGLLASKLHSDGNLVDLLYTDGGAGSTQDSGVIKMLGKEVFKHAVAQMSAVTNEALVEARKSIEAVDWFVPHQANQRILDAVARKLNIHEDRVVSTIAEHGNTSAATIPLALDVAYKDGRIKSGDLIAIQALGGGLTWGACVFYW